MDQTLITRIVEAALLASSQPLTILQLRGLFTLDEAAPDGAIEQALTDLRTGCDGRGIELTETASGYRFQVQGDVHAWVARLWTERQTRYTRATLETLAIIAYRQPITRGEIEQVRGVATNSNIIKALEEREWIRVVGHRDMPGKPELLGTTRGFLDYFGLRSLDQLPPLSELKDFGELDPQLSFADPDAPKPLPKGAPIAAGVAMAGADAGDTGDLDADDGDATDADSTHVDGRDVDDRDADADAEDDDAATDHLDIPAHAAADDVDAGAADTGDGDEDDNHRDTPDHHASPATSGTADDARDRDVPDDAPLNDHALNDDASNNASPDDAPLNDDAIPASGPTHTALVDDDDSTGA